MGGSGIRIGSEEGDMGDLSALEDRPMPPPGLPQMDGSLPPSATAGSWLRDWQQPGAQPQTSMGQRFSNLLGAGDVDAMSMASPPPTAPAMPDPMERYRRNDQAASDREGRIDTMARAQIPAAKGAKGPMLQGQMNSPSRPGTNPKTALPLYFAKAMGYEVPGESGGEEEARFAKAAHTALLKMTKGMSVAKFLSGHQSAKSRDAFGKLLDAELARSKPASPVVNTPELATTSRLPVQPI